MWFLKCLSVLTVPTYPINETKHFERCISNFNIDQYDDTDYNEISINEKL